MSESAAVDLGAKKRDYWWTVIFVDPLAIPLTRWLARRRWLTADQVTILSAIPGIAMGFAFATGSRLGLVIGALLFYVSFLLDCIDGKLARALGTLNPKGKVIDEIADGARRASGSIGLAIALYSVPVETVTFVDELNPLDLVRATEHTRFWWAIAYGFLAFYFALLSGGTRAEPATAVGGRWAEALGHRRLLPTPGTPDIAALVFFVGPLTGWVWQCLAIGCVLLGVGILLVVFRLLRG